MLGIGSQLAYGDGASPEVFTKIAEVTSIGGPGLARGTVDATNLDSPDDYAEFIGGLKDGGEVTFDVNFIPANSTQDQATGFLSFFEDGLTRNWRITFPDSPASVWNFAGVFINFSPTIVADDKISGSATVKVSGKPTLT